MPATKSRIVDRFGRPLERPKMNGKARSLSVPGQRFGFLPVRARQQAGPDIHGIYDLSTTTTTNSSHWAQADAYDADSANSLAVRKLLVKRSRYETANNGYVAGLTRTHATFVVRTGPTLRLLSEDESDAKANEKRNEQIKRDWRKWCKEINLRRKLHCMTRAKIRDGEPIAIVRNNPKLKHIVKLDMKLVETEQCTTPMLPWSEKNYIDGIKFDEFDNPIAYDILKTHPGAVNVYQSFEPEHVPAKYVLHWFELERAGQHRGIPAMTSTLGLGAGHRRFRTAVVDNAESAAEISGVMKTQGSPINEETGESAGPDQFSDTFGAIPFQRDMIMMAPAGWELQSFTGSQPATTYDMFVREHIRELARPIGMPYNVAAADASQESFAGGKLNSIPYYMVIDDLDRLDCNDLVLDPLFALWWEEYVLVKQSEGEMKDADPEDPPEHAWDWPRNPVADMASEVGTNAERLRTGQAAPSDIAHENGESFEDLLRRQARDYGKTVDEVRQALFEVTIAPKSGGVLPGENGGENGPDKPGVKVPPWMKGKTTPLPKKDEEAAGEAETTLEKVAATMVVLANAVQAMQQQVNSIKGVESLASKLDSILAYNESHGPDGRFASGDGGGGIGNESRGQQDRLKTVAAERMDRLKYSYGKNADVRSARFLMQSGSVPMRREDVNKYIPEFPAKDIPDKFGGVPVNFVVDFDGSTTASAYQVTMGSDEASRGIAINVMSEGWDNMDRTASDNYKSKWWSSKNPEHPLRHELGHALHYESKHGKQIDKSLPSPSSGLFFKGSAFRRVAEQVSGYAAVSHSEFVAETFAGMIDGKTYSEDVHNLYKSLHGPDVPKGMK